MGIFDGIRRLFGGSGARPTDRFDLAELVRRLDVDVETLRSFQPTYHEFDIPKRAGGTRRIASPSDELKELQRRILRRLLGRLRAHPAATGFERGHSIVTNAKHHAGRAVVVRMDLEDFFDTTASGRVRDYFRHIGWDREAADVLVRLTTWKGGLPQGAPTSPRLSNLVNYRLDARLAAWADRRGARYSRYADDLTFSFERDDPAGIRSFISCVRAIVRDEGYRVHRRKKFYVRRRHQHQRVTGLVVNEKVQLPRKTRRWLRAVEHHLATGRPVTLSETQLAGWRALGDMIARQREP
jgi:retron-type reverse transcriptase